MVVTSEDSGSGGGAFFSPVLSLSKNVFRLSSVKSTGRMTLSIFEEIDSFSILLLNSFVVTPSSFIVRFISFKYRLLTMKLY